MHGRPRAGKALRRRRPSFGCRSTRPVAVGRVLHGGARYSPVTIQPQCHRQRRTVTPASDLRAPARLEWGHLVAWPRVKLWLVVSVLWALIRTASSETALMVWLVRCGLVAGLAVLAYGVLAQWPRRMPAWAPRWIVQLTAVVVVMPPAVYLSYALTLGTPHVLALGPGYRNGLLIMTFMGVLMGPWIALGALLRRSEAFAREQALAFQLRGSELERQALDARLKLLQAQIEPHFLFNTLANVRSLVRKSGSTEATAMLDCLITYLRAAVPTLDTERSTFASEQQAVCAYLELMRMRMPDRLRYTVSIEPAASTLYCPPMVLLTLVENAIKHGIDPTEAGGTVDVRVEVRERRVQVRVADTGDGLPPHHSERFGTGLTNLRERLALAFDGDAQVRLAPARPHGTVAEVEFPCRGPDTP